MRPSLSPSEQVVVGGALLAIVGVFLPWLTSESVTVPGFALDGGFMALMFAVPIFGILALWPWGQIQQAVTAGMGAIIAVIAGRHAFAVGARLTGIGAYAVFVAGVLIAGASVYSVVDSRRHGSETAEERARIE